MARRQETGGRRPERVGRRKARPAGLPPPVSRLGSPASGLRPRTPLRVVRIHNGHPRLRIHRGAIAALIRLLDARADAILQPEAAGGGIGPVPPGELSLALLTAPALARLHDTFLGDAAPTDVITFLPPTAGTARSWAGPVGEICVSADAARDFAAAHRRDFSEELALYLVHGWLHLAGHDDLEPAARKRMRAAEDRALRLARAAGRIPRFTLSAAPRGP